MNETENKDNNDKESNDYTMAIILVLIGVAFICFGIAVAIKKKKA